MKYEYRSVIGQYIIPESYFYVLIATYREDSIQVKSHRGVLFVHY